MPFDPSVGIRAGFWRRLLALLIDFAIIAVPFQLLVAVLFVETSGRVQMAGGITYQVCVKTETSPGNLTPPPPLGSNFARECNVYFFGARTARILQVGRVTREGVTINVVARNYALDPDGQPVGAVAVDWIVLLAMLVYLALMETRTGATLGNRWTGTHVVDAAAPDARGVPLSKVIARYLMMAAAGAPMLAVPIIHTFWYGLDLDAMGQNYFNGLRFAGGLTFVWIIYVAVEVARKRDPVYDRVAGTAVLRVADSGLEGAEPAPP